MTQTQLVQLLADKCQITNKVAHTLLSALAQTAIKEVKKSGIFVIPGMG